MSSTATRLPNQRLRNMRDAAGLSQDELANALIELGHQNGVSVAITSKTVRRWETGEVTWPHPRHRRLLCDLFATSVDQLGFQSGQTEKPCVDDVSLVVKTSHTSQQDTSRWSSVRRFLNGQRPFLSCYAEQHYPEYRIDGLCNTGALAAPGWIPTKPIPLDEITLQHTEPPEPVVTGEEPATEAVRPVADTGTRYRRYHQAVRNIATPRLFENRLCWRLLNVDWSHPRLTFADMGFFDGIDINEALAHETALHMRSRPTHSSTHQAQSAPLGAQLPAFRRLIGDPTDLARRPVLGSVGTLTLRAGPTPSVVVHHRDTDSVAGGGGLVHLLPAGIFQPSSVLPSAIADDFNVWRNIQREYAEELLGRDEYDGSGQPADYRNTVFTAMDQAASTGGLRVWCLGLVFDALTLAVDLITVAVLSPTVFDDLFGDAVNRNTEGTIRYESFDVATSPRLHAHGRLSPAAAAALHLAWHHRNTLLPPQ